MATAIDKPRQVNAHLALLAVGLIYGANYVIAKSIMPDPFKPEGLVFVRVFGAIILFWAVRFFIPEKIDKKDIPRLALCAIAGVAVNQLLFIKGLSLTSTINASIIMTSNPIIVMLIAAVILRNRISSRKIIGVALGAVGSILLIRLKGTGASAVASDPLGDVLILINAVSYAIYLVAVKPLMSKYKPITVISWVFLFGLIAVMPFGLNSAIEVQWSLLDSWQWFGVLYVVIATTFLAYLLNIYALSIVQPTVSSAYIYLQPFFATVTGIVLAGVIGINYSEELSLEKVAYAMLIFIGIYLVSFDKSQK